MEAELSELHFSWSDDISVTFELGVRKRIQPCIWGLGPEGRGGVLAGMAAGPLGSEDLLSAWNRLVWGLTCRALRTCRGGNVRVLQLMLKPWCISRAVYQVGPEAPLLFLCSMRNSWGMVGKGCQLLSFLCHV